jgi:hypothetical protein
MICKVQKALAGAANTLIYNKDRTVLWHGPITDQLEELFDLHGLKFYAECEIVDKEIVIDKVVDPQDW